MTAADTNLRTDSAQARFAVFMRAAYARLAAGALVAWAGAWAGVMIMPLRDRLFAMEGDTAHSITFVGMAAIAVPLVLWAASRVYVRQPGPRAGAFFWLFALSAGLGLNVAFFGLTSNSLASVFAIATACLFALNLITRMTSRAPGVITSIILVAILGDGLALLMDRGLTQWAYLAVDALAAPLLAASIAAASPGLLRLWTQQALTARWNELVDFAAMSVVTLTQAPPAMAVVSGVSRGAGRSADVRSAHAGAQNRQLELEDQT